MIALSKRLLRLAGYNDVPNEPYIPVRGPAVATEFAVIISTLEEIGNRKVDDYGPFRYEDLKNWRWEIQAMYHDIERKFERLKNFCKPVPLSQTDADKLLETLSDLAIYSARGIQIIHRLESQHQYEDGFQSHVGERLKIDMTGLSDDVDRFTKGKI